MLYNLVDTGGDPLQNSEYSEEIIGLSEQQRPLTVRFLGRTDSPLRVFIMAGQHGDERYGRKAVGRFVKVFSKPGKFESRFPHIQIAVLENANPDGAAKKTRNNAIDIDLNRDHLLLDSKENKAIHRFVGSWKPHVIIDVHNFPSRRKHLLQKDRVIYYDVFVDIPTNPAVRLSINKDQIASIIQQVQSELSKHGFSCERYTIVQPSGKARHSTPDIVDARNFLALRYGALVLLLEGRSPTREDGSCGRKHIVKAQYRAILSVLRQVQSYRKQLVKPDKPAARIPIRSKYVLSGRPLKMIFRNPKTNELDSVVISEYTPDLLVTKYVDLPKAYAVPFSKTRTIEILSKHGFSFGQSDAVEPIEYYVPSTRKKPKIRTEDRSLKDYAIFPVDQKGGPILALMLEPRSKYGLHRYPDQKSEIGMEAGYPILRIRHNMLLS